MLACPKDLGSKGKSFGTLTQHEPKRETKTFKCWLWASEREFSLILPSRRRDGLKVGKCSVLSTMCDLIEKSMGLANGAEHQYISKLNLKGHLCAYARGLRRAASAAPSLPCLGEIGAKALAREVPSTLDRTLGTKNMSPYRSFGQGSNSQTASEQPNPH